MSLGPSLPFYAVPTAGRMACPLCGEITLWGPGKGTGGQLWNPIASVLKCGKCGQSYQLGIIAWPITINRIVNRQRAPLGQRATLQQLAELRKRAGGFAPKRTRKLSESVNLHVPGECCCAPLPWRQECPVHGEHGVDQAGESERGTDEPDQDT